MCEELESVGRSTAVKFQASIRFDNEARLGRVRIRLYFGREINTCISAAAGEQQRDVQFHHRIDYFAAALRMR